MSSLTAPLVTRYDSVLIDLYETDLAFLNFDQSLIQQVQLMRYLIPESSIFIKGRHLSIISSTVTQQYHQ